MTRKVLQTFFIWRLFLYASVWVITASSFKNCTPSHLTVPSSKKCIPYEYPSNGPCRNIIKWDVYGTSDGQKLHKESMGRFQEGLRWAKAVYNLEIGKDCYQILMDVNCRYRYPICDNTTETLKPQPLCRESCEEFHKACSREITIAQKANKMMINSNYPFYWDIMNCNTLIRRNGGDAPECYYLRQLNTETDKLTSPECYYGNGFGYRGNASVTRSGHVCQSWSSQCPHRHNHPLDKYPELINASNSCRNPGGQAPNGPWCYTSSKSQRWEYCNIDKCPDPAPSHSPLVIKAFSNGPYKIYLEWRHVPLPFIHGTPRGYRIRINKVGSHNISTNVTGPQSTYFELQHLQPLSTYRLAVLAFNDVGDGPWSQDAYVRTMPKHFVAIKLTLMFKKVQYGDLLNRNESKYDALARAIKSKLMEILRNTTHEGYRIFKINIFRFIDDSVGVDLVTTAELINVPAWKATQSITGKIVESMRRNSSGLIVFTAVRVKASPPAPDRVTGSDVAHTSAMIGWSAPAYSEPYNITNYTIQYKKAGTAMEFYTAVYVGSNAKKAEVGNLDANTKYVMRVEAVNEYGTESSETLTVLTKANKEEDEIGLVIASTLSVVAVLFIIVGAVGFKWRQRKQMEEKALREKIEKLRKNPYASEVNWVELLRLDVHVPWFEIPRDRLKLEHRLGEGAFGVVMKGFMNVIEEDGNEHGIHCAVKMLKENPSERELRDLLREISIMSSIEDHPNIISLLGACTVNGPPLLVQKYAPNGCLLDYLKENRPLPEYENHQPDKSRKVITVKERLKFAHEIAQGMSHLEKHRYVHRDLATRNILLGKNMVAMVSDFGLSRDIYERGAYENTVGGILPIRWMAPESLQDFIYITASDVWSYGVLLWELETGGSVPYAGLSGEELLPRLQQGYRLERPRGTSRELYSIMWKCWHPDPKQRPAFSDLVYQVGGLLALY